MIKKSIIAGIILIFIGVSISSGISIDTNSTELEECKECNEFDTKHIQFLEKQLNRLERYSKLLLVLSRYNPELKEISERILDITKSSELSDFPIICDILLSIFLKINAIFDYSVDLYHNTTNQILKDIYMLIGMATLATGALILENMDALGCENLPFKL